MFDENKKIKIIKTVKHELKQYPDYNIDLRYLYQRTNKYEDILPEIFWNIYGEPNFSNREMRKLDLSCISFENELASGIDFSYTNINLDPTKVKDKEIDYSNFKVYDFHENINIFSNTQIHNSQGLKKLRVGNIYIFS